MLILFLSTQTLTLFIIITSIWLHSIYLIQSIYSIHFTQDSVFKYFRGLDSGRYKVTVSDGISSIIAKLYAKELAPP